MRNNRYLNRDNNLTAIFYACALSSFIYSGRFY